MRQHGPVFLNVHFTKVGAYGTLPLPTPLTNTPQYLEYFQMHLTPFRRAPVIYSDCSEGGVLGLTDAWPSGYETEAGTWTLWVPPVGCSGPHLTKAHSGAGWKEQFYLVLLSPFRMDT